MLYKHVLIEEPTHLFTYTDTHTHTHTQTHTNLRREKDSLELRPSATLRTALISRARICEYH